MSTFRLFRYASRTTKEQKMIEDALVEKMERWKCDPFEMKREVEGDLLKALTIHWKNAVKIKKDIREQTLRQVMPTF